jgi:phosphatidylserine/phosphatidylglycerophosphate/cardiolipin synthase-like enzyme
MNQAKREEFNKAFVQRMMARQAKHRAAYESILEGRSPAEEAPEELKQVAAAVETRKRKLPPLITTERLGGGLEDMAESGRHRLTRAMALETIVNSERPVLFVRGKDFDTEEVTILGPEATDLVGQMKTNETLRPLMPLIGRVDVENFANNLPFVGTGWFVAEEIVVTNRHVAVLVAEGSNGGFTFSTGMGGRLIEVSLNNAHEYDDSAEPDPLRIFKVEKVLYIEPEGGPDIAFLKVRRPPDNEEPRFITVASADAAPDVPVCVIGYPGRAPRRVIPDQDEMNRLYRGQYDVKRAAPGYSMAPKEGLMRHDCTTLGGASGSVVFDLATGHAVGLHFAGLYHEENYAVRASILSDYIHREQWDRPPSMETKPARNTAEPKPIPQATPASPAASAGAQTVTIPLTITVSLGAPMLPGALHPAAQVTVDPQTLTPARVGRAVIDYWKERPEGAVAARVGFLDDGDRIGDTPCIAVSVLPSRWSEFEQNAPQAFQGIPVRYLPAEANEQIEALPQAESVTSIAYDDDARTGEEFSFEPVEESMEVLLHVGPEYSWEVLKEFLGKAEGKIVSSMYEFHATHIKDAIEARLERGASLNLVLDNATFVKPKGDDFDRTQVFKNWASQFNFKRIVAPEGVRGLISDSYHIKVTVREDDTMWLSSGNWKAGSSQPVVSDEERDLARAGEADIEGNREWHVVIKNATLAGRFRSHILQDFERSRQLGGKTDPKSVPDEETWIDVPLEESVVLERPAPRTILDPKPLEGTFKVRPLLTPDSEGAVYSKAVLHLIRSAKKSLLFQIPYIGMPRDPEEDRGYIDKLIDALVDKLSTLKDARVILRAGGSKYSSPTHAAWYFKSKGVDIKNRLRLIDNHHTKGMIVDGERVLLGSHNWSTPGVTLNRDASLVFDDKRVAEYYAEAFEIDWERSREIKPRRFVKPEAVVREAVGAEPPPGYVRVRLSDWLKDD